MRVVAGETGDLLAADSPVGLEETVAAEVVALTAERVPLPGEDQSLAVTVVEVTGGALPVPKGRVDAPRTLRDRVEIVAVPAGVGGSRRVGAGEEEGAAEDRESGEAVRACPYPEYC